MFKKTVANKEQVKLMIGLTGPSGSGKTYSALQLAYGITGDWSKIVLADTENRFSLYHAGDKTGPWHHIDFPPTTKDGYHPENWIKLIEQIEADSSAEVLILDSISHEWDGKGGCLDLINIYSKTSKGNTFTPWNIVTPLHNAFVDKIRNYSRLHIICTMRTKTEYSMEPNEKGKITPKKIGLKPIQRDNIDYEFPIFFELDLESNFATDPKNKTGLFKVPFLITSETGRQLAAWAKDGMEKPKLFFNKDDSKHAGQLNAYLKEIYGKTENDEPNLSNEDKNALIEFISDKDLKVFNIKNLIFSFKEKNEKHLEQVF